jgi:hypothetical protein
MSPTIRILSKLKLKNCVRSRTVGVCSSHSACSHLKPITDHFHELLNVLNGHFCQTNDVYFLFSVFSTLQKFSVINKIEQLPAIYFIERDYKTQFLVLFKSLHDIARSHQIQTRDLSVTCAHHSVCLPTASLPICKTGCICTFKGAAYQGLNANLVYL